MIRPSEFLVPAEFLSASDTAQRAEIVVQIVDCIEFSARRGQPIPPLEPAVKALVLAMLVLSACTHGDRIAVLSASSMALVACDVRQTLAASAGGRWDRPAPDGFYYYEMNPLLGESPGVPRLMVGMTLVEASVVWITATDKLPTWSKYVLLGALVAGEAYEVSRMTPVVGVCGGRR